MTGVCLAGLCECFEDGTDVACELFAVGGQGDHAVRAGSQERGAGDGFELADLVGEAGVPAWASAPFIVISPARLPGMRRALRAGVPSGGGG